MRQLKLDKHYERGVGDRLLYREQGREVAAWDFVGGFGGNLLGTATRRGPGRGRLRGRGGVFILDQGSARLHEGELAHALGGW